jgi:hypothetical protein
MPAVAAHVLRLDHEPIVGALMRLGRLTHAATIIEVAPDGTQRILHRAGDVVRDEPCSACNGSRRCSNCSGFCHRCSGRPPRC